MNDILQQMVHTWAGGGWVMAALALLAMILYTSVTHLLVGLRCPGIKKASDSEVQSWVADATKAPHQIRELIRYSQDEVCSLRDVEGRFREVEASKILDVDRRLAFVNVLVVAAPLFGLLGTVLGMLLTFKAIGIGGSSTSDIIAKGISEALTATQTGMLVAIPGLMLAFLAKRWRDEYVAFLVRLESITLRHVRNQLHGITRFVHRETLYVRSHHPLPARPEPVAPQPA